MPITLICARCDKPYDVKPHRAAETRFCSRECMKHNKRCARCNKPILKRPGRRSFCSRACAEAVLIGPLHHSWKGGTARKQRSGKMAAKLRIWRKAVFQRDRFRCKDCGSTKKLHAHHIKPYASHPRLRLRVSNGKTLCEVCHGRLHGKNFANRRPKKCVDCEAPCSGRGRHLKVRCRSCAGKQWHAAGRPSHQEMTDRYKQAQLPLD